MDFADKILARLEELGLNINQAEDRAGLPQGYIRGVVRTDAKRAIPNIEKAQRIAEAIGLEFYVGPRRKPDLRGFAEASAQAWSEAGASEEETSIFRRGYLVMPWHALARPKSRRVNPPTPFAISTWWLEEMELQPDNLRFVDIPDDPLGPALLLVDEHAPRMGGPANWCWIEDGKPRRAKFTWQRGWLVISTDHPTEKVTIVEKNMVPRLAILGRVVWAGRYEGRLPLAQAKGDDG